MTVAELEDLVAERASQGRCGCGCGGEIPKPKAGKRQRQKFLPDHRQRLYKRKVQVTAAERGLEPRLSLKTLNPPTGTEECSRYAQSPGKPPQAAKSRARKPSGLQVSYRKAVAHLATHFMLDTPDLSLDDAFRLAERVLAPMLSERQQARLRAVDG